MGDASLHANLFQLFTCKYGVPVCSFTSCWHVRSSQLIPFTGKLQCRGVWIMPQLVPPSFTTLSFHVLGIVRFQLHERQVFGRLTVVPLSKVSPSYPQCAACVSIPAWFGTCPSSKTLSCLQQAGGSMLQEFHKA
jgi:hypothetical protein